MSGAENRNRIHCHFAFRVRNVVEGVTEDRIMGSMGRCQQTRDSHGSAEDLKWGALSCRPRESGDDGHGFPPDLIARVYVRSAAAR
jgi:hypothetical protein